MAVQAVGSSTIVNQTTAASTWTHSHTLPSGGTDRMLAILVWTTDAGQNMYDQTTYNGNSASFVNSAYFTTGTDPGVWMFAMLDADLPAGGSSYDLEVNLNASVTGATLIFLVEGASQNIPSNIEYAAETDWDNQLWNRTYTGMTADSMIVDMITDEGGNSLSVGSGQTLIEGTTSLGTEGSGAASYMPISSSSDDMSYTNITGSGGWELAYAGFVIPPSSVDVPTVTTDQVYNLNNSDYTADADGTISDTGGADVTERGFVYSTSSHADPGSTVPGNTNYEDVVTETGTFGASSWTQQLTELESNSTIYVRAYAENTAGYSYGSEVSINVSKGPPRVGTFLQVTQYAHSYSKNQGRIFDDGGYTVDRVGFVYSTQSRSVPTVTPENSNYEIVSAKTGTYGEEDYGFFINSKLEPNTTYYFRAWAENQDGTDYGAESSFTTPAFPNETEDTRPGNGVGGINLHTSFPYFAQAFIPRVDVVDEIGMSMTIYEGSPTAQIWLCPDDGSGNADFNNPIYQGSDLTITSSYQLFKETGIGASVTPGDRYHVVAYGGMNSTSDSPRVQMTDERGSLDENGEYYDGSVWSTFNNYSLLIFVKGQSIAAYSGGANSTLPTGESNLSSILTASDYSDIQSDDNVYYLQGGNSSDYVAAQFKRHYRFGPEEITVRLKSDTATSTNTAYLQIYNYNTSSWENLDQDSGTAAGTEFEMSGSKDSTDYIDSQGIVTYRVYQLQS